jgi:hypothetical protein
MAIRKKVTLNERAAERAIKMAKQLVSQTTPTPRARPSKKIPEQKFFMIARVFEGNNTFLARVPFIVTTLPELTEVILIDDKAYVLHSTYPLTYRNVFAGKATRIK